MKASVYQQAPRPRRVMVRRREDIAPPDLTKISAPVAVDAATECHVTPPDVARRMVQYLGPVGDYLTLEPSAGTGALSRALLDAGHSRYELCQVERHNTLAARLHKLGPVVNRCFLEYAEEARGKVEFPRIVMNPPFRKVRAHIAAARSLLGRGGHMEPACMVALVPCTYPADAEGFETLEILPDTTFTSAKVRTKIIRLHD